MFFLKSLFGKKSLKMHRRLHRRVELFSPIEVRIQKLGEDPDSQSDLLGEGVRTAVVDLSEGGFQLIVEGLRLRKIEHQPILKIKRGDVFSFSFRLDEKSAEVSVKGYIVWINHHQSVLFGRARIRAGIQFKDISKDNLTRIRNFVTAANF